jgi:hypothetical protein
MMQAEQLIPSGRRITLRNAKWQKTTQPVWWYHSALPIGTEYKAFESRNFGYVWLRTEVDGRRVLRV